jgi:DNA repair protein RecO (recombination protein O)
MATSRRFRSSAFLLHALAYRETSLICELITRDYGRVATVAKGAKRPHSALRAILLQFQPFVATWSGSGELHTLIAAEWSGGLASPSGDALLCAFYLNELMLKLLPREDPYPQLFDAYQDALHELCDGASLEETLRRFEWVLLRETGHAPPLDTDTEGAPILRDGRYQWQPAAGFTAAEPGAEPVISGQTLIELAQGQLTSTVARAQAKYLARAILAHELEGAPLRTRQILIDLHKI